MSAMASLAEGGPHSPIRRRARRGVRALRPMAGVLALALGLVVTGCAPPARGTGYARLLAPSPTAVPAPSGASIAQYYTLSAMRVADRLAAASNALDDGLADRAQGRITDDYLDLIAQRSATSAHAALDDAQGLTPPATLQAQGADFDAAAAALAGAVDATAAALQVPIGTRDATLQRATTQRRTAADALTRSLNLLLTASWGPDAAGQ